MKRELDDIFHIGDKLKYLRGKHGYTQERVAIGLGVNRGTYSDYERGLHHVPEAVVLRASRFYKVRLERFYSPCAPAEVADIDHEEERSSTPMDLLRQMAQKNEERLETLARDIRKFLAKGTNKK